MTTIVVVGATGCVVVVTVVRRRLDDTQQPTAMQTMMGMITKTTKDEIDPPTAGAIALPGEGIMKSFKFVAGLCAEAITEAAM